MDPVRRISSLHGWGQEGYSIGRPAATLGSEIGGKNKEWDARITDQIPDHLIAWQSEGGEYTSGAVEFAALSPTRTRIDLQLIYDPEGFVESAGDAVGLVSGKVEGDLRRFKNFIENRGQETGAWRGAIRE